VKSSDPLIDDGKFIEPPPSKSIQVENLSPSSKINKLPLIEYFSAVADDDKETEIVYREDGGMEVPESERHEYFTKFLNRRVRDGGGIEPDVKVEVDYPLEKISRFNCFMNLG
jgi:hypothetical protein